jgi:hypothetical protein
MNFKIKTYSFFIITSLFFLFACNNNADKQNDVQKNKIEKDTCIGKVSMHKKRAKMKHTGLQVKEDTALVFAENGYKIIPEESELQWFCDKHTGLVLIKEGIFKVKNSVLSGGTFTINMDSIYDTDIDNNLMRGTLENILRSEDFFDVKKYPLSTFKITQIANEQGNIFLVKGNLKIKDVEKPIVFKSIIDVSDDTLWAQSEKFVINRTEWGITHMSKSYAKSKDEFVFTDSLQFIVYLKAVKANN